MTEQIDKMVLRDFDREMLRSSLVSVFWAVITEKKKRAGGYKLQRLADALGINKSTVSRWFSYLPNWEANTISDIANALDVELRIVAQDRTDGRIYTPSGVVPTVTTTAVEPHIFPTASSSASAKATGSRKLDGAILNKAAA